MTMKQVRAEFRRMRKTAPLTCAAGLRSWIRFTDGLAKESAPESRRKYVGKASDIAWRRDWS